MGHFLMAFQSSGPARKGPKFNRKVPGIDAQPVFNAQLSSALSIPSLTSGLIKAAHGGCAVRPHNPPLPTLPPRLLLGEGGIVFVDRILLI